MKIVLKQIGFIAISLFINISYCFSQNVVGNFTVNSIISPNNWGKSLLNTEIDSSVTLVGLGEFSHGSKDLFSLKADLANFLIKEKGFDLVLLEYPDIALRTLNEYLTTDSIYTEVAELKVIKDNLLSSYKTEEMIAFIKQIKQINVGTAKKIQLRGIDINESVFPAIAYIVYRHNLPRDYQSTATLGTTATTISDEEKFTIVKEWIKGNEKSLQQKMTAQAFLELKLDMQNAEASYRLKKIKNLTFSRDSMMAENVKALSSGHRAIIWAHNLHLMKSTHPYSGSLNLGGYLTSYYGNKYYAILTDFSTEAAAYVYSASKTDNKRAFNIQKYMPIRKSLGSMINLKNEAPAVALILKKELKDPNYVINLNTIDFSGKLFLCSQMKKAPVNFDAVIVLKNVAASSLIK
nr:erythromycin esterase family protein [Pedobacter panaciterrae]